MRFNANRDFDLDCPLGEVAERLLAELLSGDIRVEVKRDFRVSDSGRVAVEFYSRGRRSGIATSLADWWAFALSGPCYDDEDDKPEVIVFIRAPRLKRILRQLDHKGDLVKLNGGDEGTSRIACLPLAELVRPLPPASEEVV